MILLIIIWVAYLTLFIPQPYKSPIFSTGKLEYGKYSLNLCSRGKTDRFNRFLGSKNIYLDTKHVKIEQNLKFSIFSRFRDARKKGVAAARKRNIIFLRYFVCEFLRPISSILNHKTFVKKLFTTNSQIDCTITLRT